MEFGLRGQGRASTKAKKIWYGEMRIPIATIDDRPAKRGREMRINLLSHSGTAAGAQAHRLAADRTAELPRAGGIRPAECWK